jgi:hypothetical protein
MLSIGRVESLSAKHAHRPSIRRRSAHRPIDSDEIFQHFRIGRYKGLCRVDDQKKFLKAEREEYEPSIHLCLRTIDLILGRIHRIDDPRDLWKMSQGKIVEA